MMSDYRIEWGIGTRFSSLYRADDSYYSDVSLDAASSMVLENTLGRAEEDETRSQTFKTQVVTPLINHFRAKLDKCVIPITLVTLLQQSWRRREAAIILWNRTWTSM
jgi:hypothetical protein